MNNGEAHKFKGRTKPTAWKSIGCDYIEDSKFLYNRCHLIGRQFYRNNNSFAPWYAWKWDYHLYKEENRQQDGMWSCDRLYLL